MDGPELLELSIVEARDAIAAGEEDRVAWLQRFYFGDEASSATGLRELVAELQALDTYKGQLISTLSHELKNPLTAISAHLELLVARGTLTRGDNDGVVLYSA